MLSKIQMLFVALLAAMSGLSVRLGDAFLSVLGLISPETAHQTRAMAIARGGDPGQLGLGTILAAFVVVIAAFVVLIVVDTFDQSLGTPDNAGLSEAQSSILSGFGSMASLIEPLLLIAIGVVIIGLIRRVQQ